MITQAIAFVLDALFHLFILAVLVRFWMQAFRAPTRNPIAQFTMALTDWAVKPLRRVIPGVFNLDWASLVVAWAFEFLLQFLLLLVLGSSSIENPAVLSMLLFLSLVILVPTGMAMMVQMAASNTVLQTLVDEDKRGRVMSFFTMAFFGSVPFGSLFAGAMADRVGVPPTILIGGISCMLGAVLFFRALPGLRRAARPIYARLGIVPEVPEE